MALTITNKVYLGKAVPDSGGSAPVIDTLNVTPTTSAQQITAPSGTDGYSPVNVSAVTSGIDANIVAGNIKKDVQILGVTGSYEGTTPTGTKSITANGVYDVTDFASADVQVPTTAPSRYLEYGTDANGKLIHSTTASSVINLNGVTDVGDHVLYQAYYGNTSITGLVDLSSITQLTGANCMQGCFVSCTGITGVDLSGLTLVSSTDALSGGFQNCSNITGIINLSSLKSLKGQMSYCFANCPNIAGVDLSKLEIISSYNALQASFQNCTGVTSIDIGKLVYCQASSGMQSAFQKCSMTEVSFLSLAVLNANNAMNSCFSNCSNLTKLSFPALTPTSFGSSTTQFNSMIVGVTGCTVHFPSNIQSTISSWTSVTSGFGGTNTTVLFDLPSTSHLTGVNSTEYERNPKYDTSTALAWRVKDTGTFPNYVIDWTPFYTSGLTDPTVGTTIYSDSACTIAETTVDSIS